MSKNKYVCPQCGNKLFAVQHKMVSYYKGISPNTGKINNRLTRDIKHDIIRFTKRERRRTFYGETEKEE